MKTKWSASDTTRACFKGVIEIETRKMETYCFDVLLASDRVIFGGACNAGFLESGYMLREEGETPDESLRELIAELETHYNDGPEYAPRLVCNERM